MGYTTLMVHLQIGRSNKAVLDIARSLAQTHKAAVLGVALAPATQNLQAEDYVLFTGLIEQQRPVQQAQIEAAEAEFRAALQGCGEIEWRLGETTRTMTEHLVEEARGADLIIISVDPPVAPQARAFNISEFVALAGRPVLAVPKVPAKTTGFGRGMIYWRDNVATRHAVAGAVPLLREASYVSLVQTINEADPAPARKRMELVCEWFKRHGVTVDPMVLTGGGDARRWRTAALEQEPDFVVAGTHSSLLERVLGGDTRDILRNIDRCVLLSH